MLALLPVLGIPIERALAIHLAAITFTSATGFIVRCGDLVLVDQTAVDASLGECEPN